MITRAGSYKRGSGPRSIVMRIILDMPKGTLFRAHDVLDRSRLLYGDTVSMPRVNAMLHKYTGDYVVPMERENRKARLWQRI